MGFYRSNLLAALAIAIRKAREEESKLGYTRDSGFTGGLVELYEAVAAGETIIEIKD